MAEGATAGTAGRAEAAARTPRRIVLLGNPNVGKSALFNALTGLRATVSNYPGTTVEVYRGRLSGGGAEVVDSPGLNSLLPLSEDEQVTWDLVRSVRGEEGAVVVQVADAKNLRRALLITLQLGQLEVPTVLVLNMHDEAEARGIRLDLVGLEAALGIPVRTTVATRGLGIEGVTAALAAARPPQPPAPARGRGRPGSRPPHGAGRAPGRPSRLPRALPRVAARPRGRDRAAARDRRRDARGEPLAPPRPSGHPPRLGLADPGGGALGALRVRGRLRGGDARRPRGGGDLPRVPQPVGDGPLLPRAVGLRPRPRRRRVRPR